MLVDVPMDVPVEVAVGVALGVAVEMVVGMGVAMGVEVASGFALLLEPAARTTQFGSAKRTSG